MFTDDDRHRTLRGRLAVAWASYGDRPMLEVGGSTWTYAQNHQIVRTWSPVLVAHGRASPFVAVLGYRSPHVYQSILATVWAGKAYLPLNPRFPAERTQSMLLASGTRLLIACPEAAEALAEVLPLLTTHLAIICPRRDDRLSQLAGVHPEHQWLWLEDTAAQAGPESVSVGPSDPAYLLFTSGSTGRPKGVAVTQDNVCTYLSAILRKYDVQPTDRLSQMFELTFDLSVHDMFVAWQSGACLCVVPERSVMAPAAFIKQQQLTMWFSVPSVAMFMNRMRMLKPGAFPSLRASLFCGEALAASLAEQWQAAAPQSVVDNLYGPTEATIAICDYRWDAQRSPELCRHGLVPIGRPFPGQAVRIVGEQGQPVACGETGELCLAGSQVTPGYFRDAERTAERFVHLAGDKRRWYRTGDLVQQDEAHCLYFLGRVDSQVQILGHRVELSEIDGVLREAANTELAVSVAWPLEQGRAEAVYGFVVGEHDADGILAVCRRRLPEYMVPRQLIFRTSFPLNSNGKIDRNQLVADLREQKHDAA